MRMLKSIFLSITCIVVIASCTSTTNDWDRFGLKGEVMSYKERSYKAEQKFGEWMPGEPEEYGNSKANFDTEGRYMSTEVFDNKNRLTRKFVPKYENGKIVEEAHYDGDGKLELKGKFEHASDDGYRFESFDEEGEKVSEGESIYENHRIVKQFYRDFKDGDFEITILFEYNENGYIELMKQIDAEGDTVNSERFEYPEIDKKGNWTKKLNFKFDDKEPSTIVTREYEYY
ncbi:MAG: hypothetical protein AAFX87_28470 [Bacteroidota bacterium]